MYTDPSGHFGLANFSVAQTIQGILQNNRAVTNAVAGRRLVYKLGCFALEEMATETINMMGVYIIEQDMDTGYGKGKYVGKGGGKEGIRRRLRDHLNPKMSSMSNVLMKIEVQGNKGILQVVEQYVLNAVEEDWYVTNDPKTPPLSRTKKHKQPLRDLLNKIELNGNKGWCK